MPIKGYKAKVTAEDGLLLGGVKVHTTASFECKQDALEVAGTIYRTNKASGRSVAKSIQVFEVNYIDITAGEVYEDE